MLVDYKINRISKEVDKNIVYVSFYNGEIVPENVVAADGTVSRLPVDVYKRESKPFEQKVFTYDGALTREEIIKKLNKELNQRGTPIVKQTTVVGKINEVI